MSKPEPTTITYTLTYVGTPIKENSTIMEKAEKQAEEEFKKQNEQEIETKEIKEIKQNNTVFIKMLFGALLGILFSSGMVLLFHKKSQKEVKICNLQDDTQQRERIWTAVLLYARDRRERT